MKNYLITTLVLAFTCLLIGEITFAIAKDKEESRMDYVTKNLKDQTIIVNLETENHPIKELKSIPTEGIRSLHIKGFSADLQVEQSEESKITFDLTGKTIKPTSDDILKFTQKDDVVFVSLDEDKLKNLTRDDRSFFGKLFSITNQPNLTIQLTLGKGIDELQIELLSGDIFIKDINLRTAKVNTTSGDIHLQSISATESLSCVTVSGDIQLDNITTESLDTTLTSGDIEGKNVQANSWNGKTISGDISADLLSISPTVNFKSVSGDINLKLASEADLSIELNSLSGDIDFRNQESSRKTTHKLKTGKGMASIKSVSGDIQIE